jgi:hypothetical protein
MDNNNTLVHSDARTGIQQAEAKFGILTEIETGIPIEEKRAVASHTLEEFPSYEQIAGNKRGDVPWFKDRKSVV